MLNEELILNAPSGTSTKRRIFFQLVDVKTSPWEKSADRFFKSKCITQKVFNLVGRTL